MFHTMRSVSRCTTGYTAGQVVSSGLAANEARTLALPHRRPRWAVRLPAHGSFVGRGSTAARLQHTCRAHGRSEHALSPLASEYIAGRYTWTRRTGQQVLER